MKKCKILRLINIVLLLIIFCLFYTLLKYSFIGKKEIYLNISKIPINIIIDPGKSFITLMKKDNKTLFFYSYIEDTKEVNMSFDIIDNNIHNFSNHRKKNEDIHTIIFDDDGDGLPERMLSGNIKKKVTNRYVIKKDIWEKVEKFEIRSPASAPDDGK